MLPDFPEIKEKHAEWLRQQIKNVSAEHPILGQISRYQLHEGSKATFLRDDKTKVDSNPEPIASDTFSFTAAELESITPQQLLDKYIEAGKQLAEKQFAKLIYLTEEAVKQTGNSVDAKGLSTGAAFLASLEKIPIDFTPNDIPILPSLIHNVEGIKPNFLDNFSQEELISLEALMHKKKDEWDVREADRKLVD